MGCDVLNLEWASAGRDREVASLICHALRRKGYSVVEGCIFDYRYLVRRHRPRLLYCADPKGAPNNYAAVRFAERLGLPVVTFTSEGNYLPSMLESMFWGHIRDRRLHERINLQWSRRARDLALQLDAALAPRLPVAGGVGFDRYRIYSFMSRADWMRQYGKDYARMVGYAGWGFDMFHRNPALLLPFFDSDAIDWYRRERAVLNAFLRDLVARNTDVLFLLKEHPGVVDRSASELAGLQEFPNVIYVHREHAIGDCIGGCDLWMAFESTTCMEAWLLDRPTLMITPSGDHPAQSNLRRGCPVFRDVPSVQRAMRACLETGSFPEFLALAAGRRQVIEDTIQWDDGKNHLRAAHLIESVLCESGVVDVRCSFADYAMMAVQHAAFRHARLLALVPRLRRYATACGRFRSDEMEGMQARCRKCLEPFDDTHPLSREDIAELEAVNDLGM